MKEILKRLVQWAGIFFALVFFPDENQLILFGTLPSDWYAEKLVKADDNVFILAKNSSKHLVQPQLGEFIEAYSEHLTGDPTTSQSGNPKVILPRSLNLIKVRGQPSDLDDRQAMFDSKRPFKPGELKVWTTADFYYGYILASGLLAAFTVLGFFIARFECHVAHSDVNTE